MYSGGSSFISLPQLMNEDICPIDFVVDGLLSPGLYILAGPPKSGKSWLALWLCLCIAKGQPIWDLPVQPGGVLYLCLEDNKQRLQNRLLDVLGDETSPDLPVHFMLEADAAGADLIQALGRFVEFHPATCLIVIDTLQKIRPEGVDYSYAGDYQIIGELKQFAEQHNLCVLAVHHTRKLGDTDPLNTISGTTGLSGAADGLLVLRLAERTSNKATLLCTGRDIESRELKLEFDRDSLIWQKVSDSLEKPPDALAGIILQLLDTEQSWSGTASDLSELLRTRFNFLITASVLAKKLRRLERDWQRFGVEFTAERTGQQRSLSFRLLPDDSNDGKIYPYNFTVTDPENEYIAALRACDGN